MAPIDFPNTGLVRLSMILAPRGPIPVAKSTWWAGVKSGRFPKPTKLGPRTTVWKAEDILALFNGAKTGNSALSFPPEEGSSADIDPPTASMALVGDK